MNDTATQTNLFGSERHRDEVNTLIDPRVTLGDTMPDLRGATTAELRHWLSTDPERWGRAAGNIIGLECDIPPDALDARLRGWFAAAIEAGRIEGLSRRGLGEQVR
jgi:hypothetical protein